jgi:[ribosomal protein S5]-alanine N-acetyltransferase
LKQVKIQGEDFYLVNFTEDHISTEYLRWLKDKEVNKYLLKPHQNISFEEASEYCNKMIKSKKDIFLAILEKGTSLHIGNVRLGPIDWNLKHCKFSMMIGNKEFHGKGLGTKIVRSSIDFVFSELKLSRFYLDVLEENKAAIRTYEKNGLIVEKMLKNKFKQKEKLVNALLMSVKNELK